MAGIAYNKAYTPFNRFGTPAPAPSPIAQQYKTYDTAVKNDTADYDALAQQYKDLLGNIKNQNNASLPDYNPKPYDYIQTQDQRDALKHAKDIADNGGYSTGDIQNIRDRAISPIRSIYAGAERDVNRRASITGNSASFGALKAKFAREQSQQVSDAMTSANANIAEKQAAGKREGRICLYIGGGF
jgi:hypothetical protein